MDEQTVIVSYGIEELLDTLKPYQKNSITQLIAEVGEEEAAKKWLSANGPSGTQKFGGGEKGNSDAFWDKFIAELRLFICDDKYKSDRKKLLTEGKPAALVIVSSISGFIGATLGFAPALLAPAIAVILPTISKVGFNAWCKCDKE